MSIPSKTTFWYALPYLGLLWSCYPPDTAPMNFEEHQLTHAANGHTIHHTQVFSADNQWIVFDTRNDDTQIGSTGSIEMVNIETAEVRELYRTNNQTTYGPGVGAATFSPALNRVLFIHGIRNADATRPYGLTRRTGVAIDTDRPGHPIFMDARDINAPFTKGALRGGTHAHSWSADGHWISFTYNDYVVEQLSKTIPAIQDIRTVGVMVPGRVNVSGNDTLENNSGLCFSAVVAHVTENPKPESDEIDKAFDECWIGEDGYYKSDGSKQRKAIAFQGNVRTSDGQTKTEVFVVDLPDDLTHEAEDRLLAGTTTTRPAVPLGVQQRRVTYTESGVQGPRHWLRTTPDGKQIMYLAKDSKGVIQIFGISTNGGTPHQLTDNLFPVSGPFNIHPNGRWLTYPADNSIFITDLSTAATHRITPRFGDDTKPVGAPNWSPNGKSLAYNRYIEQPEGRFLQVFILRQSDR